MKEAHKIILNYIIIAILGIITVYGQMFITELSDNYKYFKNKENIDSIQTSEINKRFKIDTANNYIKQFCEGQQILADMIIKGQNENTNKINSLLDEIQKQQNDIQYIKGVVGLPQFSGMAIKGDTLQPATNNIAYE